MASCPDLYVLAGRDAHHGAPTGSCEPAVYLCLVIPRDVSLVDGIDDRRVQFPAKRLDACQRDVEIELARVVYRDAAVSPHSS